MTTLTQGNISLLHIREINQLLARWNPLEVPKGIAPSEYLSYAEHLADASYTPCQTEDYLFGVLDSSDNLQNLLKRLTTHFFTTFAFPKIAYV